MAKVRRNKPKGNGLSIETTEAETDLGMFSIWFHGIPKIGKTSLASKFPQAVFGLTEKGAKAQDQLDVVNLYKHGWEAYPEFLDLIREDTEHKTVVIDVLEKANERCMEYMREEENIDNPEGDEWNIIRKPFCDWALALLSLENMGTIFLSHTMNKEFKDALGEKNEKIHPALTGKPLTLIEGEVDIIAYIGFVESHRVIQILGDEYVMAGNRLENNFTDTEGEKVKYVPMGRDASEAYDNFIRAFENEQKPEHTKHLFPSREKDDKPKKNFLKKKRKK